MPCHIADMYDMIVAKRGEDPEISYTASLFKEGTPRIAQKVGEEGVEVALAAVLNDKNALIGEVADLFYHTLVLLANCGVTFDSVVEELERRKANK